MNKKTQCLFTYPPSPAPSPPPFQQHNCQSCLQKPVGRIRFKTESHTFSLQTSSSHTTLISFRHSPHGHLHTPHCPPSLSILGHLASGSAFIADPACSSSMLPQLVLCPPSPSPVPCKNTGRLPEYALLSSLGSFHRLVSGGTVPAAALSPVSLEWHF